VQVGVAGLDMAQGAGGHLVGGARWGRGGLGQAGAGWDEMGQGEMGWDEMGQDGIGWGGVGQEEMRLGNPGMGAGSRRDPRAGQEGGGMGVTFSSP